MFKGCIPSKIDVRDYKISSSSVENLPSSFMLACMPKVKNQRNVNSCVAHATSSILEFFDSVDGMSHDLSTNFIYGIQKKLCGHEGEGMYLRDACNIVKEYGDPVESLCKGNTEVPYSWQIAEDAFSNEDSMSNASYFRINSYYKCNDINSIKKAIYKYGPVLASIKWYDTFKVNKEGILTGKRKGSYGYHAVVIYGWNEKGFFIQNSWGTSWGNRGCAVVPYEIPIAEARALIDASIDIDQQDISIPKNNSFLSIIYGIINYILNIFRK